MACYFVYGSLGAGKGIFSVRKLKQYAARGSRVACNFDVIPEKLTPNTTESIFRLPDHPRIEDFELLGRGAPDGEKKNLGAIFLDELATWMNARAWNDKSRAKLLDWFIHARKHGWDVYLQVQDPESVDKQLLKALGENFVCCSRLDHLRIPIVSDVYDFYRLVRSKGKEQHSKLIPHINRASYRLGKSKQGNKPYQTETYKPEPFFGTYDTNQVFDSGHELCNDRLVDMRACYSFIPGKTLNDWYNTQTETERKSRTKVPWKSALATVLFSCAALASWSSAFEDTPQPTEALVQQEEQLPKKVETNVVKEPSIPLYLDGVYISGYLVIKRGNQITYDYAIHDKYHRSFDIDHYAISLTPAAPCLAWLTTMDNVTVQISCAQPNYESPKQVTSANSLLEDFKLSDVVEKTVDAI